MISRRSLGWLWRFMPPSYIRSLASVSLSGHRVLLAAQPRRSEALLYSCSRENRECGVACVFQSEPKCRLVLCSIGLRLKVLFLFYFLGGKDSLGRAHVGVGCT